MNVGELKQLLESLSDNAPVLIPASDHCFVRPYIYVTDVAFFPKMSTTVYEELNPYEPKDKQYTVEALVIGN